jgi:hypothetical protein
VRDVGSPWLKVCLDPADLADRTGLDLALPATVQAHARMRDVAEDGSDTRITWPLLVQTLQLGRYRGFLLLDYEGIEDPETAVPRAARYLRGVLHLLARQRVLSEAASTEQVPEDLAADNATETADDVVIRTSAPTRSDALSRGAAR